MDDVEELEYCPFTIKDMQYVDSKKEHVLATGNNLKKKNTSLMSERTLAVGPVQIGCKWYRAHVAGSPRRARHIEGGICRI